MLINIFQISIRFLIATTLVATLLCKPAAAQPAATTTSPAHANDDATSAADDAFWDSVYNGNHVLDIQIRLTREAWQTMEPAGGQGGRSGAQGGRGGQQGGRGRPGRPPGPPGFGPPPGQRPPGPPPGQRGGPNQGPPNGPPGGGGPPQGMGQDGNEYTYVESEIVIDGETLSKSGLRFKGNSSYRFSANTMKRPMKIDTDRFTPDQRIHGRTKLNLSNSYLDPAFMKEKLGYELYRAAGLPTPGVGWANVTLTIDGKKTPLGVYVVIEQVDSRYIISQLGKPAKGSLLMKPESVNDLEYLGDDPAAYEKYDIKKGENDTEQIKKFADLAKWVQDSPKAEFDQEVANRIDLPRMAGYLAATSLLGSIDSYIGMPHNYYLVLDKTDGKLRLLPWDVNEAFGTFTMGTNPAAIVDWDIDRPWVANRPLLERLFETEAFPKLYRAALTKLMDDFTEEKLFARIETFEKVLKPLVGKYKAGPGAKGLQSGVNGDRTGINRAVDRSVFAIKPFITKRIESVSAQLAGESEGTKIEGRRRRR